MPNRCVPDLSQICTDNKYLAHFPACVASFLLLVLLPLHLCNTNCMRNFHTVSKIVLTDFGLKILCAFECASFSFLLSLNIVLSFHLSYLFICFYLYISFIFSSVLSFHLFYLFICFIFRSVLYFYLFYLFN